MKLTPITAPITEVGQYIIRWKDGSFELITVFLKPKRSFGGIEFEEYLAISEKGGKTVGILSNNYYVSEICKIHD